MIKDVYELSLAAENFAKSYRIYQKILEQTQHECPHEVKSERENWDSSRKRICERCGLTERTRPYHRDFKILTGRAYGADTEDEFDKFDTRFYSVIQKVDKEIREEASEQGEAPSD